WQTMSSWGIAHNWGLASRKGFRIRKAIIPIENLIRINPNPNETGSHSFLTFALRREHAQLGFFQFSPKEICPRPLLMPFRHHPDRRSGISLKPSDPAFWLHAPQSADRT